MGRAPCCEKIGLKKGPWSPEEDHILIDYINTYGHPNWRALPKHAGLLRCGKSCRLRWTNYLRPDIKRGNFTPEEEDAIINLHEMLGNRWSAIAARLPGRTDNEIKNVWHTNLKKRLPQYQKNHQHTKPRNPKPMKFMDVKQEEQHPVIFTKAPETTEDNPQCSSYMSTLTTTSTTEHNSSIGITTNTTTNHDRSINNNVESPDQNNLELDDDFWSEVLSADNSGEPSDVPVIGAADQQQFQSPFSPLLLTEEEGIHVASSLSMCHDSIDFWYDIYMRVRE